MNSNYFLFSAAGLLAAFAYDEISFNKIATQSHNPAIGTGYDASNAVDQNTATCMRTDLIGGESAPHNTVWWKVDLGGVYNIYSIKILFKNYPGYDMRQRGRFAGFSLYVSNTDASSNADIKGSNICYKNGPQLPTLNFTKLCTEPGRYVIFYNERLNGVTYPTGYEVTNVVTELCEVTVQGCNNASIYGSNCDTPCPINCKDSTCSIQSGVCFNCKPGWTGMFCDTKCGEGWYGINCSQQCVGHCREGTTCNHVTGQCDRGCAAGWTGLQCLIECNVGNYGYDCVNNCSSHCLNNSQCNKQTGHCDRGCSPGYTNDDCNKECPYGHFGLDCRKRCSGHCANNEHCDHVSGICPSGCQDGYIGTQCYNACVQSYGEHCQHHCSLHCYNKSCDRFSGRCLLGCEDGFYGGLCDRENVMRIQNTSNSINLIIGLSVSVLINLIFIVCGILLCRRKESSKLDVSGNLRSCWKKSIYQDIVITTEEGSTYEELHLSKNVYQKHEAQ